MMIHRYLLVLALLCTGQNFTSAQEKSSAWQANPEISEKLQARRGNFNYFEANVPKYELPNPLMNSNGEIVATADEWQASRRGEILQLFREHVYGIRPSTEYKIVYETLEEKEAFNGAAVGRSMQITLTIDTRDFRFPFVLFVPKQSVKPVPAVVHINNRYFVPLEKAIAEPDPFWPVKNLIERGYATASFHTSDVDPDQKDGYEKGVRAFFADGQPPGDTDWRSLSAWGWAASRILDHLDSLEQVDGTRVAVVGHSRGGKTSLWAASEDERFAIAYSNNSGCGGAALSRRAFGETVERITSSFPHWFCKTFSEYSGNEGELPVDQHEVIGLIAPRAVYVTSADEDLWADPRGEYTALVESGTVFRLLGESSISESEMPALNSPRVAGKTGYHIRTGGHGLTEIDWNWFLDFADLQFTN